MADSDPHPAPEPAKVPKDFRLSERGAHNYVHCKFWDPLEAALAKPWRPETPDGTVMLGLAENSMMHDEVAKYIQKHISVDSTLHLTYGYGPRGSHRLRNAVAAFLTSNFKAQQKVTIDQIIVMSGVTSVIDSLAWSICNEGEGLLVPMPNYSGFGIDLPPRSRALLVPVSFRDIEGYSGLDCVFNPNFITAALEKALERSHKDKVVIKGLLLSSPHNPLGRCYSPEALRAIATFCGRHNLHLLSDEVYANSVFKSSTAPDALPFTSVLALDLAGCIPPELVHVLYAASKDFCANGLRLGILQSRNEGLLGAVGSIASFTWPSYMVQDVWASMLEDEQFLARFFSTNQRLLSESWDLATHFFDQLGIKYYREVNAAMFIWIDLRHYLLPSLRYTDANLPDLLKTSPNAHIYRERELWFIATCLRNGVSVGPGSNYFTEELGWFRITFAVKRKALELGLERVAKSIREMEDQGWDSRKVVAHDRSESGKGEMSV